MSSEKLTSSCCSRGIPLKSDADSVKIPVFYLGLTIVFGGIGLAVACAIYTYGVTAKYEKKIGMLAEYDLGWVYLGLIVVKLGVMLININLGIQRKAAKINVPDQQVYSVYVEPGKPVFGYVLMEKEGALGCFNRAQRALQNFLEQAPMMLAMFFAAGFVFPFPAFVLAACFMGARVAAAVGYTTAPGGRMAGNILGTLTLES
ncbi:unnamed protein product, partial [Polarella glacialis]